MSLEQKLDTLTVAVTELIATMKTLSPAQVAQPAANADEGALPTSAEAPAGPAAKKSAREQKSVSTPAVQEVSYEDVRKAILDYNLKHGQVETIKKLGLLGVKSGKDLKPEQYGEALDSFLNGGIAA